MQAIQTALQILHRRGVGDAHVGIGAEGFAGDYGHALLRQQPLG